eukprot:SM002838S10736  [mRNA]  locus=s2838:76:978:- [translate_table: standard]
MLTLRNNKLLPLSLLLLTCLADLRLLGRQCGCGADLGANLAAKLGAALGAAFPAVRHLTCFGDDAFLALVPRLWPRLAELTVTGQHWVLATRSGAAADNAPPPLEHLAGVLNRCVHLEVLDAGRLVAARVLGGLDVTAVMRRGGLQLQTLRLPDTNARAAGAEPLDDRALAALAPLCPRLEELSLCGWQLSAAGVVAIALACPRLRSLDLREQAVSAAAVMSSAAFCALKERCPRLQSLVVPHAIDFGPSDWHAQFVLRLVAQQLQSLSIAAGAKMLIASMTVTTSLTSLDLNETAFEVR